MKRIQQNKAAGQAYMFRQDRYSKNDKGLSKSHIKSDCYAWQGETGAVFQKVFQTDFMWSAEDI